ncbi:CHAP domain-containing protein [Adlercreutzia equolifaciens]|uniref:CHAP domain-containing protein n=1 Tax=Adlercreutzia equolifaciens TaxID=446660 RepID=UPI00352037DF
MATASDVLRIARAEVGYCRYDDPERGTKYGRWYESEVDGPGGYDYGANGVAYCAMFASWVLAQGGVSCAGMPGAYCPSIHHSQTLAASQLQPGDLVLFDWEDDGTDDHIGIVASNDAAAKKIETIEGNTSGGRVAERTRAYSTICGGIRPAYDGQGSTGALAVDRGLVLAVCNGDYGNDPERRRNLEALGYDYEAVRLAVNAYLRGGSFGGEEPSSYKITTPSGVNVRRAAAKGSAKVTAYARGAVVTVTATETDSAGNLWGKTSDGWFAIRYQGATYAAEV